MSKTSQNSSHINEDVAYNAAEVQAMAKDVSRLGYQPNRGVTIAAFTPDQEAAMANTNNSAAAFGMNTGGGPSMPAIQTSGTGVRGYSTGAEYDDMLSRLPEGYRKSIQSFFADPNTPMARSAVRNNRSRDGGKK